MHINDWIGILIEVFVADVLVVLGLAGQKVAVMQADVAAHHITLNDDDYSDDSASSASSRSVRRSSCVNWKWLLALAVFGLGQSMEAVALKFGTQTEIVAMGNFGILWNALFSVLIFKEEFSLLPRYSGCRFYYRWDLFAVFVLVTGASMTIYFAPRHNEDADPALSTAEEFFKMWIDQPYCEFGIFMLVSIVSASVFLWKNWHREDNGNTNAVVLASLCASISSFTVTGTKVVVNLLANPGEFRNPSAICMTLIWAFFLASSVYLLNLGLGRFEQGLLFPIYEVMSSTLSIISGLLYYKTYKLFEVHQIGGFVVGLFTMAFGIWLTSQREHKTKVQLEKKLLTRINSLERMVHGDVTTHAYDPLLSTLRDDSHLGNPNYTPILDSSVVPVFDDPELGSTDPSAGRSNGAVEL